MARDTASRNGKGDTKTVASMIREAIDRNGFKDVKECARGIKVPYDLFNKVVGGHIPKDQQLLEYAKKLKIDNRELILAAYRERAPEDMKAYFNSVALVKDHNRQITEILDIVDNCNSDQLEELLKTARMIKNSSREKCKKALSLLETYQEMDTGTMAHFESLVVLALKNHNSSALRSFKRAVDEDHSSHSGRRGRLRE